MIKVGPVDFWRFSNSQDKAPGLRRFFSVTQLLLSSFPNLVSKSSIHEIVS